VRARSLALAAALALPGLPAAAQPRRRPPREARSPSRPIALLRVVGATDLLRGEPRADESPFALDLHAGLRLLVPVAPAGRYVSLGADVGVSLRPAGEAHPRWLAGVGVGYGNVWVMAQWWPRLVVGEAGGAAAVGVRNTLAGCMFLGLACLELSHQHLWRDGGGEHELRASLGLDLGMVTQLLVQFAGARPG
jgi:hypothetical protein